MKKGLWLLCALGVLLAARPALPGAENPSGKGDRYVSPALPAVVYAYAPVETGADLCETELACDDKLLWAKYQKTEKKDKYGDFTFKDPKAADHADLSLEEYVIGGMDPRFRILLGQAFPAMEEAACSPGITSGFRDDYRQSLIRVGVHAAAGHSYHGGDGKVRGYGHGLAVDLVCADNDPNDERHASSEKLWKWIDNHPEFDLRRPYPGYDPAHVVPSWSSELGIANLRSHRYGPFVVTVKKLKKEHKHQARA